jgi:hypothetical protein
MMRSHHFTLTVMRTTIDLDPELLAVARKLAAARSQSLGKVISELAMQALRSRTGTGATTRSGFPTFRVRRGAALITSEDVKRDEDQG